MTLKLQFNQEKNDGFLLLGRIFEEYIKQNIIIAVLQRAKEKLIQTFILSRLSLANLLMRF